MVVYSKRPKTVSIVSGLPDCWRETLHFYCTIDKLVDIRKDFVKELHKSNLQSCFNDAAFSELTRTILKRTCRMKLDKIGKFLSAVSERSDALLRETEWVKWAIILFFFRSGVVWAMLMFPLFFLAITNSKSTGMMPIRSQLTNYYLIIQFALPNFLILQYLQKTLQNILNCERSYFLWKIPYKLQINTRAKPTPWTVGGWTELVDPVKNEGFAPENACWN